MGSIAARKPTSLARRGRLGALILVSAALVVLSGCMEINLEVDLRSDGSGVLMFETVIPKELVGFMEMAGQSLDENFIRDEFMGQVSSDVADRVDLSVKRSDGAVSIRMHVRFTNLDELNGAMLDGVDSTPLFYSFELHKDGEEWVFSATPVDMSTPADSDLEDLFGGDDPFSDPQVSFTMAFSGGVIESNADQVKGRSATWNISDAGSPQLTARARVAGGSSIALVAALALLGVVVVVGGIVVVRARSRRGPKSPDTGIGQPIHPIQPTSPAGFQTAAGGPPAPGSTVGSAASAWAEPAPSAWWPESAPVAPAAESEPQGPGWATPAPPGPVSPPTVPQSPPMVPPGAATPADVAASAPASPPSEPNWYPDPWGEGQWRWYDGTTWTSHVQ